MYYLLGFGFCVAKSTDEAVLKAVIAKMIAEQKPLHKDKYEEGDFLILSEEELDQLTREE